MLITPRVSEKSYKLVANNVYVFDVPLSANKAEVITAIESQYDSVKVKDVRLMIIKGKPKAVNRGKRARPTETTRKDTKKAYVTVAEGKIEVAAFSEIDNQARAAEAERAKTETKAAAGAETKKASLITRRRTGKRGDR
ncbi:MAG: 50S ribosomal protein L23 [Candidatus Nomurabacteria bacterium]|jgi:large subunit ribosomal protein L23|nr:50S ribosomal protein L23 [Candidatus Nomurabacteria bacterium]